MPEIPEAEIEYPRRWRYRIVGTAVDRLQMAAQQVVGDMDYTIQHSRTSATGKYHSLIVDVHVPDSATHRRIHKALHEHPDEFVAELIIRTLAIGLRNGGFCRIG